MASYQLVLHSLANTYVFFIGLAFDVLVWWQLPMYKEIKISTCEKWRPSLGRGGHKTCLWELTLTEIREQVESILAKDIYRCEFLPMAWLWNAESATVSSSSGRSSFASFICSNKEILWVLMCHIKLIIKLIFCHPQNIGTLNNKHACMRVCVCVHRRVIFSSLHLSPHYHLASLQVLTTRPYY